MTEPRPFRVLCFEDDPDLVRLLTRLLTRQPGVSVDHAGEGANAVEVVLERRPDLVLLDINMPDMDGYAVCKRLKADPRLKDIPVIFISALTETLDKVRAFQAGGVDYVAKPFDAEEVGARVQTHLTL